MKIVGVTGTNVLNYYFVSLNVGLNDGCGKLIPNGANEVAISTDPGKDAFCIEPVKKITTTVALTNAIYFVPAFDFNEITVNGTAVDISSVDTDAVSLYKLSAGAVTKISL